MSGPTGEASAARPDAAVTRHPWMSCLMKDQCTKLNTLPCRCIRWSIRHDKGSVRREACNIVSGIVAFQKQHLIRPLFLHIVPAMLRVEDNVVGFADPVLID